MMIRQAFHDLPPKDFIMQVLDNTSKLYVFLWDRKDENNQLNLTWEDLSKHWDKKMFRNRLRKLNNEGLLSYNEAKEGVAIELVGWEDLE